MFHNSYKQSLERRIACHLAIWSSMHEWRHNRINCIVSQNFTKLNKNNKSNAQHMVERNNNFFRLFFFGHANSFWSSQANNSFPLSTVKIVLNASEQCNSWNIWIDSFNQWHTQTAIEHITFFENVSSWKWVF